MLPSCYREGVPPPKKGISETLQGSRNEEMTTPSPKSNKVTEMRKDETERREVGRGEITCRRRGSIWDDKMRFMSARGVVKAEERDS